MSFANTYSREQLQGLQAQHRKERLYSYIDNTVSNTIIALAKEGKKEYFWELGKLKSNTFANMAAHNFSNEELIAALLEKFPGTHVEYQETWVETRPGVKEQRKGILIDWS